jgi:hypothetical protein
MIFRLRFGWRRSRPDPEPPQAPPPRQFSIAPKAEQELIDAAREAVTLLATGAALKLTKDDWLRVKAGTERLYGAIERYQAYVDFRDLTVRKLMGGEGH